MTTEREEAEHDRAIAVKALRAAADAWTMGEWLDVTFASRRRLDVSQAAANWLRARADRIEGACLGRMDREATSTPARVEAARVIRAVRDGIHEDFDRLRLAIHAGGTVQEMKTMSQTAWIFEEVMRQLDKAAAKALREEQS